MILASSDSFINDVKELLHHARQQTVTKINHIMVLTYFEIGRKIVEEEQGGKKRATYGKGLLKELSKALSEEFGKGFSLRNLEQMRQFYLVYSKSQAVSAESAFQKTKTLSAISDDELKNQPSFHLSWSHYIKLMRIEDEHERMFYEIEAVKNSWSLRELQRQYDSGLYLRLSLSKDKKAIQELSKQEQILEKPKDTIKDPYILEFLGLPEEKKYSENELEQKIIDKLEHFLLELGRGFMFVGRQERFTFDEKHFRVDLVFYNRILQCF